MALPERGHVLERWAPYDLLRSRPVLRATVRPVRTQAGVEQWVSVTLNGAPVARSPLTGTVPLSVTTTRPLRRTAPNVVAFEHEYRRGPAALGPAHRIGTTGVTIAFDAIVRSGGQPHGDVASIRVGMGELASNRRGYNLVALAPTGELRDRAAFDTLVHSTGTPIDG